ncbi:type II secretion system F family protein [Aureimonas leprariae]|uniref:Type II secretion system F family protein n=1 Tax=Plantimonas leprariae TaxID=2615207 RepID=A0A7V7U1V7_9HYPH|nr:type II secretion system F family protein [Aureimonas leprariae]KAB0682703.1 type II secretion system F family protein [Aureimonas leprariae]
MAQVLFFALFAALAASGLAYAVLQPRIANEKKAASRLGQYSRVETNGAARVAARDRVAETAKRRKTIQNSLKELDDREKERSRHANNPPLRRRMEQAGLSLTERQFMIFSAGAGLGVAVLLLVLTGSLPVMLGGAIVGGLGLPRFVIATLRKRRLKKFSEEFPNAIDLIVRGVRAGLPVNDTLRMISTEAAEPVRSEFRKIVEAQQLGISAGEAVERLYQNVPLSETNFFAIVIAIQSQAGGNLSEALGNLSKVLRERRKMRMKVQAMSMEAKSSAAIIGALPVLVGTLIYIMSPEYISLLFTESMGHMIIGGGILWMTIGVVVMRQMINFDF